jgi:hypothetical protein
MKKLLFALILIFEGLTVFSQVTVTASTGKIGPFKLNMFKKDVEQIVSQKINLQYAEDEYSTEVKVNNNGVDYTLTFQKADNIDSCILSSIRTTDNRVKTLSGLGIGNTKNDLWNAYSDKYYISLYDFWEENKETHEMNRSLNKRRFEIHDTDTGALLFFILQNNIVTEIGLEYAEGD